MDEEIERYGSGFLEKIIFLMDHTKKLTGKRPYYNALANALMEIKQIDYHTLVSQIENLEITNEEL